MRPPAAGSQAARRAQRAARAAVVLSCVWTWKRPPVMDRTTGRPYPALVGTNLS
jgi:hypothetical protein